MTRTYEHEIFGAIQGHGDDQPVGLVDVLAIVDSQQRLVLTHEELAGGLDRLISQGRVAEAGKHLFYDASATDASRNFSGLLPGEYEAACRVYRSGIEEGLRHADNDPGETLTRQKIVIRWKINDDEGGTDEDEEAAEALAHEIDPILKASGLAEINGIEFESGYIDILVFGKESDEDTDQIYALIAGSFRKSGCPVGSCIVRQYRERHEEVISDVVPDV